MSRSSQRHARELYGRDSNGWDGQPGTPGSPGTVLYDKAIVNVTTLGPPVSVTIEGGDPTNGASPGRAYLSMRIDGGQLDTFSVPIAAGDSDNDIAIALSAEVNASARYNTGIAAPSFTVTPQVGTTITFAEGTVTP